jgi:hypothetical protein
MTLDLYPVQEEKAGEREKKRKERESGEIPPISLAPPLAFPSWSLGPVDHPHTPTV